MSVQKVNLVQMADKKLVASQFAIENLASVMEVRGFKQVGVIEQRPGDRIQLRAELIGQPKFEQLAGPMYDGPGVIRYEDWLANDVLSR
ncbi:MAG TPA: hypothetical protein VGG49_13240 [Steroidobacteraceae bacterium]|jgi:hypothetical protein